MARTSTPAPRRCSAASSAAAALAVAAAATLHPNTNAATTHSWLLLGAGLALGLGPTLAAADETATPDGLKRGYVKRTPLPPLLRLVSQLLPSTLLLQQLLLLRPPRHYYTPPPPPNVSSLSRYGCQNLNYCSGHGKCRFGGADNPGQNCDCYPGWGASADVAAGIVENTVLLDCSGRTCPTGMAWGDVPSTTADAHGQVECSGRGMCERLTGECVCQMGFTGSACQRTECPASGTCSGHGTCMSIRDMARRTDALPLSPPGYYGDSGAVTGTWDAEKNFGCLCDSSWPVGLGAGETQQPEWFGPDCAQRRCPSGDDPFSPDVDETDCGGVLAAGGKGTGAVGNLCHLDCSGRGVCGFKDGACRCHKGHHGANCGRTNDHW